ncbi:MAG: glutamate racemase [Desulfobacteraceae bacterium]|nr:glutamate racemase [Desulfobacteraceae bacterium]
MISHNNSSKNNNLIQNNAAIGVFDSGIGGLTVVKHLRDLLPHEDIVYFGDTARLPYGIKSEEVVKRFAFEDSHFLLEHGVKIIVVACNTVGSTAIHLLEEHLNIPVIGVMQPGADACVKKTRNKKVGVIGTATTIRSGKYSQKIHELDSKIKVIDQACPLFVPLVEEGFFEDEATHFIAKRYLDKLIANNIDTLILGCTHYPVIKNIIQRIVGEDVVMVDSGEETAKFVEKYLASNNLGTSKSTKSELKLYVSDLSHKFQEIAEHFLHNSLSHIETIDFEQFLIEKGQDFRDYINQILIKDV